MQTSKNLGVKRTLGKPMPKRRKFLRCNNHFQQLLITHFFNQTPDIIMRKIPCRLITMESCEGTTRKFSEYSDSEFSWNLVIN